MVPYLGSLLISSNSFFTISTLFSFALALNLESYAIPLYDELYDDDPFVHPTGISLDTVVALANDADALADRLKIYVATASRNPKYPSNL
ncbi:hypothetical protein FF38_08880 [Lucilia cuprina]|uniref:Uncharacterized protein n=1 Tax=Lucilia cuprina TaxID=7375 RepID=A0A0L0BVM0_LUCCU|nr:hypothetical protein FF38_08880 [Lucilia cuprina]